MQLEDYFNFLAPNDIRLKGTRVGIERILYDYIHRGWSPEKIEATYRPALTLEQVYATITYYLHKKEEISQYLMEWIEHGDRMRAEQEKNPDPTTLRLREIRKKYGTLRNYLEAQKRHEHTQVPS
ncbi:DUF433 domain-containing protein [Candidatus Poribacteria bacterium]|nr:DUF433 domain-containing protein [Candidatus Poribacteria bacterium]